MPLYADFALFDRIGRLIAIAEVKTKSRTSRTWAAMLRRNMLAHGAFPSPSFFLLVTPDKLYLWKEVGFEANVVEPTFEIDSRPLLTPYFESAGIDPSEVSGRAFELVVAAWLADLIRLADQPENLSDWQYWLLEIGLLDAVRGGRIEYEVTT